MINHAPIRSLAIIGHAQDKFTSYTEPLAYQAIYELITLYKPRLLISGGCHLHRTHRPSASYPDLAYINRLISHGLVVIASVISSSLITPHLSLWLLSKPIHLTTLVSDSTAVIIVTITTHHTSNPAPVGQPITHVALSGG